MKEMDKRRRSYDNSLLYLCCTPTEENGKIWQSFLTSSRGFFTLRCQKCGELTMKSCDVKNLQFESTYNEALRTYQVKRGTERLICPKCGFEHTEDMKHDMIVQGAYVHENPEMLGTHPGFQFGALASQLKALSWSAIAQASLDAGKKADESAVRSFDNSFRGMPYHRRVVTKDDFEKFRQHCWRENEKPSQATTEFVFITSDTQDNRSVYGVWSYDINDNLFLLEAGEKTYMFLSDEQRETVNEMCKAEGKPPVETLEDLLSKEYLVENGKGIQPLLMVVDKGGHRSNDVSFLAKKNPNVIMQQGTGMSQELWRMSENVQKLILSNSKHWQATFIYFLYSQKTRHENYFFVTPHITDEQIAQITCVRPDPSKKFRRCPRKLGSTWWRST